MAIEGLAIIGESINDSVPSTHEMFENNDLDGIVALAKKQQDRGAAYVDVNVGRRSPDFMAELVKRIQAVVTKPLSIDTPDPDIAAAGLRAYDPGQAGGAKPILNSISPLRLDMLDLCAIRPFMPILMVSERVEDGVSKPNRTASETYDTVKSMLRVIEQSGHHITVADCIVDTGIAPVGSDTECMLMRVLDSMKRIHGDAGLAGIHMSVGLSNFTVMLPPKCADGTPVKSALESAFLTMAMPLGLDMVVGSVARKYELLPSGHPAMKCLADALELEGYDVITRVIEFYS